jgi:hypothetical protein
VPYSISTSIFSFIQFDESDNISACNWATTDMCLPVFAVNDVWFQFIIRASTPEEADALCSITADPLIIGHVQQCSDAITPFAGQITRYRISPTEVLYHWSHGITTLNDLEVGDCFRIGIEVFDQFFCSNCFQRIANDCFTNVVEYSQENDNAFGFNYCAASNGDQPVEVDCQPLIIEFNNEDTYSLVWTAYLQSIYGPAPSVEVWVYDGSELVKAGLVVKFDTYPPTVITIDMGGPASGIIKIM